MPERGISRFIPLFVILALLIALALYYAPGVIRAWKFRATANAMLADVRSGKLGNVPQYVVPDQQPLLTTFVSRSDVKAAVDDLQSLKLSHYHREDDHIWATVTGKLKQEKGILGQGQAKLRWVWDGKRWQLDALNSYVTQGITTAHNQGFRIGDLVDSQEIGDRYQ